MNTKKIERTPTADSPLHILFREHPTRNSTAPWSQVREKAMREEVRNYVTKAVKAKRRKVAARQFGVHRIEFHCTTLPRPSGEEEVIWTVYHSDAEVTRAKKTGVRKVAR